MDESIFNNLIVKHYSGELSEAEEATLQNWIAASPENRHYFEKISNLLIKTQPQTKPNLPDKDEEWRKLEKTLNLQPEKGSGTILHLRPEKSISSKYLKSRLLKWQRYAIAASFFIIVLAGVLWVNYLASNGIVIVETKNSETKQIQLSDGTIVNLNNASKIEYARSFSDSIRQIFLIGEAFFNVVPEKRKFVVNTKNNLITALGTKFNIWSRNDVTRLIVAEGKVSFELAESNEGEKFILKENQMAVSKNNQIEKPIDINDSENLLGWLKGRIVFNETGLQEVVDELNRIYDINIILENPSLKNYSISGSFEKKPIKDILEAICLSLDLQFKYESDKYIIY